MYNKRSRFYFLNIEDNITFDEVKAWFHTIKNTYKPEIQIKAEQLSDLAKTHKTLMQEERATLYQICFFYYRCLSFKTKDAMNYDELAELINNKIKIQYELDKNIFVLNFFYNDKNIFDIEKWHEDLRNVTSLDSSLLFKNEYYHKNKYKRYDISPLLEDEPKYIQVVDAKETNKPPSIIEKGSSSFAILPLCFILRKLIYPNYNDKKIFNMGSKYKFPSTKRLRFQLIAEIDRTKYTMGILFNNKDGIISRFKKIYKKYILKSPAKDIKIRRQNRIDKYKLLKLIYSLSVEFSQSNNSRFRFWQMIRIQAMENYDNPFDLYHEEWDGENSCFGRAFKAELMLELDLPFITAVEKSMSYTRYSMLALLSWGTDLVNNDYLWHVLGGASNVNILLESTINKLNNFSEDKFINLDALMVEASEEDKERMQNSFLCIENLNLFEQIYFLYARAEHLAYYHDLRKCYKIAGALIRKYNKPIAKALYEQIKNETKQIYLTSYEQAKELLKNDFDKYREFIFAFDIRVKKSDSDLRKAQRRDLFGDSRYAGQFEVIFNNAQKYAVSYKNDKLSLFTLLQFCHIYLWLFKLDMYKVKNKHHSQTLKNSDGKRIFVEKELTLRNIMDRIFDEQNSQTAILSNLYIAAWEHIFDIMLLLIDPEKAPAVSSLNKFYLSEARFKYKLFKSDKFYLAAMASHTIKEKLLKDWVDELEQKRPGIFRDAGINAEKYTR